ncbi:hypothetical protein OIU77_002049 [Salix suchowensis]|uniref:La-related protein 6B n=1 Tax=Salix suchowensis TaxID=1278906 RepID=A0ABQ9B6H6_9ROSI|nr:hypothetical protein OIU77_002049 [Salix suchowensis]
MAQQIQEEEELVAVVESVPETLDQSPSPDPSLSRNVSFSKLNAQAPRLCPHAPPTPTSIAVARDPSPPPPPPAGMMHMYPPSPFHVPIHSPVPLPHVIPVPNQHHHHNHYNQHQQQYVQVRKHNQLHNSKRVPQQFEEEVDLVVNKDAAASSDHATKSDEAMNKLLNQVEYYFSDLNLATTDHLMRFITKDPEGYVPISVVASFKKVKAVINNNSQLATILRNSTKLVVSEDGKKVRRQHPLTGSDVEELQSRIVVAENLPEDHCHQNLMKIFSAVGSVKTIRTCPPQPSGGGASASRSGKADGMHFSNKLHAFVEYETVEIAEKAVAELNDEGNWRSGLKVRLMLKHGARGKKGHDGQGNSEEDEVSASEQMLNEKQTEDQAQQHDAHSHELSGEDHANDKEGAQRKRNRARGKGRGRGQYHHNNHPGNRGNHMGTPPSNPVIGEHPTTAKHPPGPRMPDGTRGFAMGRGKPVAVNIA